jgi:hypothetical protein
MPQIALPIKLYERRKGYQGHSLEAILSGLSVRVDEDRSDNIEENFPVSGSMTVNSQEMKYSIYVFKKGKHINFTKEEGIVFTINGQTHGYLGKAFFNRKGVGLNYLSESILVILDCSEIDGRERENLFMNSRDRLSTCPLKTEIENELEDILKKHPGLNSLKEKRRREEIDSKLSNQQPLTDVLQNILKKSPTLSKLFITGQKLNSPFELSNSGSVELFDGKEFPTFFTLIKKHEKNNPKQAHLESKFRVEFKTDVENEYFNRSKYPGTYRLYINNIVSENKNLNLWNGYGYLNVLIDEFNVGDILELKLEVNDINRPMPIIEIFYVKIIEALDKKETGDGGNRIKPSSDKPGNETNKPNKFSLPNIIEVSKDNRTGHSWIDQGFNQETAIIVKGSDKDGYDFFINVDNLYLLSEIKSAKTSEVELINAKYKFGMVLIGLSILNNEEEEEKSDQNDEIESIFSKIEKLTKALSPMLIPMIDSLGSLEINDVTSFLSEENN